MPTDVLVRRLQAGLRAAGLDGTDIHGGDLYELHDLSDTARNSVIDAIIVGDDFPIVVVGEAVVCAGGVDVDAVAGAPR